jgi:hypothetical protein
MKDTVTLVKANGTVARENIRAQVSAGQIITFDADLISYSRLPCRELGHLVTTWSRRCTAAHEAARDRRSADLPVQAPTKYDMVINLKTAKAMGLSVATKSASVRSRTRVAKAASIHSRGSRSRRASLVSVAKRKIALRHGRFRGCSDMCFA